MNNKKKVSFIAITALFFVSLISATPSTLAYGEDIFGHNLSEEKWSLIYDFAGSQVVSDPNPGPLSENMTEGKDDDIPNIDSNFFVAWNNFQNVQSLYLAMQNFTWDIDESNSTLYGCAPYQLLLQHFRPPGQTQYHIFIENWFDGLLAYRELGDDATKNDVPDEEDALYLGWSYYSEYHKWLVNRVFKNRVPDYALIDDEKGTGTPIHIEEVQDGVYKYGITYENIFILWKKLNITEGLDNTVTSIEVMNRCSAFGILSELTFEFVVSLEDSEIEDLSEVTTTTEYDIGEMSEFWVIGDNETRANYFGGESYDITFPDSSFNVGYYNNSGIKNRIDGNESQGIPGFSLAVLNHANIIVVDREDPDEDYSGETDFIDQTGDSLGVETKNITEAQYDFADQPAYKLDFASKPNYTLNGEEEYPAPTRVLKNEAVKSNVTMQSDFFLKVKLAELIANTTGASEGNWFERLKFYGRMLSELGGSKFFYMTCFPKWSGGTITQDPQFTVYVPAQNGGRRIPGFEIATLTVVSLVSVSIILLAKHKFKK
ncbi:MAG: exported protein of unknown function [Promethearchaeota archaeon]|nr:MAG: exported protein of unknown function [Candidatus Lokiarchaeota archaeon]